MLEIVFDTETTGFDPFNGDRLVEIGCVEVQDFMPTGRVFHKYINPERDMPSSAEAIHGLSAEFLKDHPVFAEVAEEFVDFVGDAKLVAHNAEFDMKFINWELENLGFKPFAMSRAVDTLAIARRKFPGSPNTLDALCKRFSVDNSGRIKHGALLDAELLAEVYLELMGGRQTGFSLAAEPAPAESEAAVKSERKFRAPRPHAASEEELARHREFLDQISEPLWLAGE
ncbi:DNA polymerase III subunit epsilon [Emcibacter nanhaiensis]|uniref:DNA polymerase III subunit epsilon n=1 Tax=Emcibacter nanhaiensis TaxID=1505037 RepID=A0A501PMB5_9PROT|nr:DNA polymerase III subunit epsilon [Emcibacter nanhaiensis]TPD61415.1 DNA polymerase III subunit epsilon [Emcibacter nanhaiensis]